MLSSRVNWFCPRELTAEPSDHIMNCDSGRAWRARVRAL
ncbi:hypothetical protein U91I_01018 [alpha proteobacterium U9-1i]|nr:hypothetical protein U91I_01018 [alpha proteobacterium U9-1i]